MGINSTWNLAQLDPQLSEIALDHPDIPTFASKLAPEIAYNATRDKMPDQITTRVYAGFGAMPDLLEDGTPHELKPGGGFTFTTGYRLAGARIRFSEVLVEDDKIGICDTLVAKLRDSLAKRKEYQLAGLFLTANDASATYKGYDGKPLVSSDHTTGSDNPGATRTNTMTYAALGKSSLKDALIAMNNHTDMLGDPEPLRTDGDKMTVMLTTGQEPEYYALVNEYATLEPYADTNTVNVLRILSQFEAKPIVNFYFNALVPTIEATAPWFIFPKAGRTGVSTRVRRPYSPKNYVEDGTNALIHQATTRYDFRIEEYKECFAVMP